MKKIYSPKLIFFSLFIAFFTILFSSNSANAEVAILSEQITTNTTSFATSSEEFVSPWEEEQSYEMEEPLIRVGIYKTPEKVIFTSPFPYSIESDGSSFGRLAENETATLTYTEGVYRLQSVSLDVSSFSFLRLVPDDLENFFSIHNLDRHLIGRSQMNFATFRGALEYRFSPKSNMPYVINELLLENYVAGIAETSNGAPEEYIKALQIAARTYAFTNIAPISLGHMFDVFASTVDQLYLGYNFEQFSPRIAFYTAGTRGMMVMYKEKPVTTYYYSRSNGKTKTKKNSPWLKSVICKYDKGWSQLGHGYGMSNRDAALRAKNDKWSYDKILTYYYSGTKIRKMY